MTGVADIHSMLDQAHAALGDQHARTTDLLLWSFLRFEVAFGSYEAAAGSVRLEGLALTASRAIAVEIG